MRRGGTALDIVGAYASYATGETGVIRRDATKAPGAGVAGQPLSRGRSVPLVGKVTAGQPILAIENIEDYLIIPNDLAAQEADLFRCACRAKA